MDKLIKDIEKQKNKLISIANKKGIYEDFGQKEVRELQSKYTSHRDKILINQFDLWCMNYC